MSDVRNAQLVSIIQRQSALVARIAASLAEAMDRDVKLLGRSANAAVMVDGLLENYYTCLETAYHKISQHFENQLDPAHWHSELLGKMVLRIEGVRVPAVSESTYPALLELQRFRHFKRYYLEAEYDWDRLEYLARKVAAIHPAVLKDLERFVQFVRSL